LDHRIAFRTSTQSLSGKKFCSFNALQTTSRTNPGSFKKKSGQFLDPDRKRGKTPGAQVQHGLRPANRMAEIRHHLGGESRHGT
jgi:hypothetical protein